MYMFSAIHVHMHCMYYNCKVKECMAGFDSSHDFYHILRVRKLALQIGNDMLRTSQTAEEKGKEKENIHQQSDDTTTTATTTVDLELVEVVALLHDVNDHKYIDKGSEHRYVICLYFVILHN